MAIMKWGQNIHVRCFEDAARAIADALRTLGHDVVPTSDAKPGRLIVMGANNMAEDSRNPIPRDMIVYNTEQIAAQNGISHQMQSYKLYRNFVVWDYSQANIDRMREFGLEKTVHCPLGYIPSMTKIAPAASQDVDVLWVGSVNQRREEILSAIEATGLKVKRLFGMYGEERDAWIARSKVVLNLHFYERAVFEVFRCSHLWANKKCVLTEDGGCDAELERLADRAALLVQRNQIVTWCQSLVEDEAARRAVEDRGFDVFSKIDLVENVRRALEQS